MGVKIGYAKKEFLIVFAFSIAVIFGNAYLVMINHDANFAGDESSYLAMSRGDWNVSVIHRYRIIVPFLAKGMALTLNGVKSLLGIPTHDLPLGISYLIVNSLLMALSGLLIYKIAILCQASWISGFIAVLGVLTSGYCSYISGLALVDSLYFLITTWLFYSALARNEVGLIFCLLIGPLAKESFWMFLPFIVVFFTFIPFYRLVLYLLVSIAIFFLVNHLVDLSTGLPSVPRAGSVFNHVDHIFINTKRLFSSSGIMSWFSAFGFFNFLVLIGLISKKITLRLSQRLCQMQILFLLIIFGHAILSGDIGRMWYLAAPAFAVSLAMSSEKLLIPFFNSTVKTNP